MTATPPLRPALADDTQADDTQADDPQADAPAPRRCAPLGAIPPTSLLLGIALLVSGCGEPAATPPSRPEAQPPVCPAVDERVLPDRWITLAQVAASEGCDEEERIEAVRAMAEAGPEVNLVLPVLKDLAAAGPSRLATEARRTIRYLNRTHTAPTRQ